MNIAKMKKNELIDELNKRNLSTEGLKDELKSRLMDALENEGSSGLNSNQGSENGDSAVPLSPKSDNSERVNENSKQLPDPSTELTVEDTLNMKKIDNTTDTVSMIVNATDDGSEYATDNQPTSDVKDKPKIDLDNGDDEILEVNDVSIDLNDEDRRDNNEEKEDYNDDIQPQTNTSVDKLDNDDDVKDRSPTKDSEEDKQAEIITDSNPHDNTDGEEKIKLQMDNKSEAINEREKRAVSIASSNESWGATKKWNGSGSPKSSKKEKSKSRSKSGSKGSVKKGGWGDSDDERNICVQKEYSPRKSNSPSDFPKRDFGSRPRRGDFRGGRGRRGDFRGGRGGGFRGDRFRNDRDDDRPPRSYGGGSRDYGGRERSRERYGGDRRDDRRDRDYSRRDDFKRVDRYDDRHGAPRSSGSRTRDYDDARGSRDYNRYGDRDRGRLDDSRKPAPYERVSNRDDAFRPHQSSSRRDYGPPKRPLKYEEEYPPPNFHKKRRDESPDAVRRDRFRQSPKRHSYTQGGYDREYRKPDYRPRDSDDHSSIRVPPRKHVDYGDRRRNYEDLTVVPDRRPRKDRDFGTNGGATVEFGGRSRHYD